MPTNKSSLEVKISKLQDQNQLYLHEIKELIAKLHIPKKANAISYFTTSLNISHNLEQESLCIGSYHIHNIGTEPLLNPSICIKIPNDSPFSFSGRYIHEQLQQRLKGPNEWIRFTKDANTSKNEYWLKPLSKTSIEPNETISFPNFQLRWSPSKSYSGSIIGITYCDQFQDGITVLNPINLSVIQLEQEETP